MNNFTITFLSLFLTLNLFAQPKTIELKPLKINMLVADINTASGIGKSRPARANIGKTFPAVFQDSESGFKWTVKSPGKEKYFATVLMDMFEGDEYILKSKTDEIVFKPKYSAPERAEFGMIEIPAGTSTLEFIGSKISNRTTIRSVELVRASDYEDYKERIKDFKEASKPNHFTKNDVYGVMYTYGKWSVNPEGQEVEWPKGYESLDIEKFAQQNQDMGVSFVILSLSWAEFFMPAPIKSVENIAPGRTTIKYGGRDYVMEIADALNKRGIKLFLYYHVGHGDKDWWKKNSENSHEKFLENWKLIIGEFGNRYGKKIAGWWFDDGMAYYPADFEELSKIARKGNPERLITYNNWKYANYTDFSDYSAGENHKEYKKEEIKNGVIAHGKDKGLIPFGLWRTENHWAAYVKAPKIKSPGFDGGLFARQAYDGGYTICFNLMMYSDGTLDTKSIESVKKAKKALEEKGLNRKFKPINQ